MRPIIFLRNFDLLSLALSGKYGATNRQKGSLAMNGKDARGGGSRLWYLLLLIPILIVLSVGSYDRAEPSWGGFPFFYWYQLLWIPVSAVLTLIVYLLVRD